MTASGCHLESVAFYAAGDAKVAALSASTHPPPEWHQVWVVEEPARVWRMDVLLEPGDGETWVCRRDETIRRACAKMVAVSAHGIPYLRPEGVLLHKAKASRAKDEADFAACAPLLDAGPRGWLKEALQRAHPGHRRIAGLGT